MTVEAKFTERLGGCGSALRHGVEHVIKRYSAPANTQVLADLALKYRLPMVFTFRSQAEAGGLMAFTANHEEVFRRAGSLAARILQGARPADLPVEQPTKYQFVLNLKTAKALGLTIPPAVLARADEVIQ